MTKLCNQKKRIQDLETLCAESYQVVGALAEAAGVFNELSVIKALDNLSAAKPTHKGVLPFTLPTDTSGAGK